MFRFVKFLGSKGEGAVMALHILSAGVWEPNKLVGEEAFEADGVGNAWKLSRGGEVGESRFDVIPLSRYR